MKSEKITPRGVIDELNRMPAKFNKLYIKNRTTQGFWDGWFSCLASCLLLMLIVVMFSMIGLESFQSLLWYVKISAGEASILTYMNLGMSLSMIAFYSGITPFILKFKFTRGFVDAWKIYYWHMRKSYIRVFRK